MRMGTRVRSRLGSIFDLFIFSVFDLFPLVDQNQGFIFVVDRFSLAPPTFEINNFCEIGQVVEKIAILSGLRLLSLKAHISKVSGARKKLSTTKM